jgi:type II secretory pathway pseudopilin PulG
MAFVPFFSTYYIGVCAQVNKVYGAKTQTIALIATIAEVICFAYYIFYYAVIFTVRDNGFYIVESSLDVFGNTTYNYVADYTKLNEHGWGWMGWIYDNGSILVSVFELIYFVFSLLIYISFFQTYSTRYYWIFAVTAAFFPISGILFFVVRNNRAKNYRAYIKAQQEQMYRMHQQYYNNQYNNPYNQNPYNQNPYNQNPYNQNPYNQNPNGNNNSAPDPFDGYGSGNNGNNGSNGNSGSANNGNNGNDDPFDGFDK